MDRKQIEAEHIVERYLADQLTPADAEAFEAYYLNHPNMVREIEQALRLREGLATLRDRGQLDELMNAPGQWRRWATPLSIAAAITVALVGGWAWLGSTDASPVAATLEELVADSGTPLPLGGKYLLVRTRGAEAALAVPFPAGRSALELQMLPSAGAEGAPYRVTVSRADADDRSSREIGEVKALGPGPDGLVSAVLDSQALEPGRYAIELAPERSDATVPPDRFLIELR
jgi:hypothetical protein